jgi:TonB family protein
VVALIAAVALFVYPGLLRTKAPVNYPPLSLRAERTSSDLLVTWNRNAESVRTAVKAVLTISDGPQQENLQMDLAQLRNGNIVYTPATPDVSFRLEVTSSDPSKNQSELLRVLKSQNEATASKAAEPAAQAKAPAAPTAAQKEAEARAAEKPVKTPAKPFNTAGLASPLARLRAARPSDMLEPPPPDGSAPPVALSGAPAAQLAIPQAPVPAPPPAPKQPAAEPLRVGGVVRPAELSTRREPVYPPLARQSRVGGAVKVDVKIGTDGRVKEVKAIEGHPMLRGAAVEAVKQWIYKPATLNGQPVESNSRVEINFVGGK